MRTTEIAATRRGVGRGERFVKPLIREQAAIYPGDGTESDAMVARPAQSCQEEGDGLIKK